MAKKIQLELTHNQWLNVMMAFSLALDTFPDEVAHNDASFIEKNNLERTLTHIAKRGV